MMLSYAWTDEGLRLRCIDCGELTGRFLTSRGPLCYDCLLRFRSPSIHERRCCAIVASQAKRERLQRHR